MNCKQAKELKIYDMLLRLSIYPAKERGNSFWYISPIRSTDKNPSFVVDINKNIWSDLGDIGKNGKSKGGDIVDLVEEMFSINTKDALDKLESIFNSKSFFFERQNTNYQTNTKNNSLPKIVINKIQNLQNKALVEYINGRKIPLSLANQYVKECYYKAYEGQIKSYFGVCFKNDTNGFEIRTKPNEKDKEYPEGRHLVLLPKDITTIQGKSNLNINLFEGVYDFLSALVYYKTDKPTYTTIVLNTTKLLHNILTGLNSFKTINVYFDNDLAGIESTKLLVEKFGNKVKNYSNIYKGYKDFNEFICNSKFVTNV